MDSLEQELRRALARREPPPGFTERVVKAARARKPAHRRWLAAAAMFLVITGGAAGYRWREGMVAKQRVLLAVKIAGGKLYRVQAQMKEMRP
jgi:uncharacterized protein involved in tolerance to divalent cations